MPGKTTAEWRTHLAANSIPASRVNSIDDLLHDPQLEASGLFTVRDHPTEERYIEVGPPVRFSAVEKMSVRHAPTIGEHTEELNRELGLGGSDEYVIAR
jgi:crotonobetainyl-CoA:carnitine CoA-transferase CaiB-like acyl-CoA transferase